MTLSSDFVRKAQEKLTSQSVSVRNYTMNDCIIAYKSSTNGLIQTIRFVHIFCCFIGIICSTLFIIVLVRASRNLHVNLRVSLVSLAAAAWIACTQLLFTSIFNLWTTMINSNPCNSLTEAHFCAIMRFPVVLAIYSTLLGILALAVERSIATWKYKTYEVHGSKVLAVILVSFQWVVSLALAVTSSVIRTETGFVHYCTVYVSHPKTSIASLTAMSLIEAVILIYFVILLQSNQHRQVNEFVNNAMHTLTERYQLQENVRIMRILIPSMTVHAILTLLGLSSMLSFAALSTATEQDMLLEFAPFSEVVLLVVPIYSVVFPLVAVLRNEQLKQATRSTLPFLFNPIPTAVDTAPEDRGDLRIRTSRQLERDSDTHFLMLNDMWKK